MQMNEIRGVHKSPLPRSEAASRRKFKEAFERAKTKVKLGLVGASIVALTFFSPSFDSYHPHVGPSKAHAQTTEKPYKPKYKCEIRGYPYFDIELKDGIVILHNRYWRGRYGYNKVDLLKLGGEIYTAEEKEEIRKLREDQIRMILYARTKKIGEAAYLIFDHAVLAVFVRTKEGSDKVSIGISYDKTPDKSRILLGKDQILVTEDGYLFATSRTAIIGCDEDGVVTAFHWSDNRSHLELKDPKFEVDKDNKNSVYLRDENIPQNISIKYTLGVK
ncbi:MAG: hypothetical protein QXT25_01390 [Candidatus Anstonellaceae archaeon]